MLKDKWIRRYSDLAKVMASYSKDRSTGVGAIIFDLETKELVSTGYNGFPRNVDDDIDERHERPQKYLWTEHAERNALYNALRNGANVAGKGMMCTMFPCADCARGIIQSGIKILYTPLPDSARWNDSHKVARDMLSESGVFIIYYDPTKLEDED